MKKFFQKNWEFICLGAIVGLAIFLRTWHFSDWLHFGMDQARDANLVSKAVENGPSSLPLLGPRAGGTYVRLGPAFYYFQYLSAKIFQTRDPAVFAYPDLLFSILTIPIFFFFLRRYFEKITSLFLTALYTTNFVIIQFSRFAWNPNSIPFWTLLAFFAFLKSTDEERKKRRYLWLSLATFSWAVASQLHFIVLAAMPVTFLLFLLWTGQWRNFTWREVGLVALLLLILFSPVILSDIKIKGDNLKQFIWAFRYKPQEHSFFANLKESLTSRANYYTLILTTYVSPTGKASLLAGMLLFFFGLGYTLERIRKEQNEKRKKFLKLIFVWSGVAFLVLVPFAFQIKPRFLFFEIFLPFIFVGFGLEWLMKSKRYRRFVSLAALALTLGIVGLNCEATKAWFEKLEKGKEFRVWGNRLVFVQYPKAITRADFEELADYLAEKWRENPTKFYFYGNLELRNPPLYILKMKNPQIDSGLFSFETRDFSGRYFAITTQNGGFESLPKKYQAKFDLIEEKKFAKLAVQELKLKNIQPPKSEVKNLEEPKVKSETEKNIKKGIKKSERVWWGDILE